MSYPFILSHRMPSATKTGIPDEVARYERKATINMTCALAILATVNLQETYQRPDPELTAFATLYLLSHG